MFDEALCDNAARGTVRFVCAEVLLTFADRITGACSTKVAAGSASLFDTRTATCHRCEVMRARKDLIERCLEDVSRGAGCIGAFSIVVERPICIDQQYRRSGP